MQATPGAIATGVEPRRLASLRRWHVVLLLLHAAQAVAVFLRATDFAVTITRSLPTGPPGTPPAAPEALFELWFGCAAGAAPWVAVAYILLAAETVPSFVVGIFVSLFVFFGSFGLNQWLQYRETGPWRSYTFGEKAYLVLSLVAKSALAWQIFGGSLAS